MFKLIAGLALLALSTSFGVSAPLKEVRDSDILPGQNVHWTADTTWVLYGTVFVDSGATLTIDPGTIIKAYQEFEGEPTCLVICKNAKILAQGTENKPIIFTAFEDDPSIYNESFDKDNWSKNSFWSGIMIFGNAPVNKTTLTMIGGNSTNNNWKFGGSDPTDSSGILSYVSIRFTGLTLNEGEASNNNALTLGGVGNRTVIDHVEAYGTGGDGYNIVGGTVHCNYLISALNADDAFEYSNGWNGSGQFWFNFQGGNSLHSFGLKHDGGLISDDLASNPVISNATFIGPGPRTGFGISRNAGGQLAKFIIYEYKQGFDASIVGSVENLKSGKFSISNSIFWGTGDPKSVNKWIPVTGGQHAVIASEDGVAILLASRDTIKNPFFKDWNSSNHSTPDFQQYPVSGDFKIIDTSGIIGFDFRPVIRDSSLGRDSIRSLIIAGTHIDSIVSPALQWCESKDTLKMWHNTNVHIKPTQFIGAFSPTEMPWYSNWSALWNYGFANRKISTTVGFVDTLLPSKVLIQNIVTNTYKSFSSRITSSSIIIKMDIMENVSIDLFSLSGRKIATVFSGQLPIGNHTFALSNLLLANGNYICSIKSKNLTRNGTLVIQK